MSLSDLPPLNALRAFAALAQTGSHVKAGTLLNVTHAAVSQQVKTLEEWLEIKLVERKGRGIGLTAEGLALSRDLDSGFSSFHRGISRLQDASLTHPVQLSTSPAFATEWLMPRIQDFQAQNPNIPLMLNPTSGLVELQPGAVEIAIRYTDRNRVVEVGEVKPVLVSDMVIVAHPELTKGRVIKDPLDLIDLPWLEELGTSEIAYWFGIHGINLDRAVSVTKMPGNLIMQAVRRGIGISYTSREFFKDEIESGAIQVLFTEPDFGIYYITTCPGPVRLSVAKFMDWLLEQAG